jgi:hypothetical protein
MEEQVLLVVTLPLWLEHLRLKQHSHRPVEKVPVLKLEYDQAQELNHLRQEMELLREQMKDLLVPGQKLPQFQEHHLQLSALEIKVLLEERVAFCLLLLQVLQLVVKP